MPDRRRLRRGFTILELIVSIMIAGVLVGIIVPRFGMVESRRAVRNARDAFVHLAARATSTALERGEIVCIEVVRADARIEVYTREDETPIDAIELEDQFGAQVTTSTGNDTKVCYSARGFATDAGTNVPDAGQDIVTFTRGAESAEARVRPLGQVEAR
ncbi:MAG: pilus assembly FimT family protein [Gemmatimonadota bacterium]